MVSWFYNRAEDKQRAIENLGNYTKEVYLSGLKIETDDLAWAELIELDLAAVIAPRQAVWATEIPLLAGKRFDDLAKAFAAWGKPEHEIPAKLYYLYVFCVLKDKDRARFELEKVADMVEGVGPALLLGLGFGDLAGARASLVAAEKKADKSWNWTYCAKIWHEVFNDDDEARRCLKQPESVAEYSFHWTTCAGSWHELFNDDRAACRCLEQAESVAESSTQWRHCAASWHKLFSDHREARRCLKRAESVAKDGDDWIRCANSWDELFNDDREARRCRKNAKDAE